MNAAKPLIITALCTAVSLAGCAGSGSHRASKDASAPTPSAWATAPTSGIAGASIVTGNGGSAASHRPRAAGGRLLTIRPVRHVGTQGRFDVGHVQAGHIDASQSDDDNEGGAQAANPCSLVSLSEAQAITRGAVVSSAEAPLGPTCVYRVRAGKAVKGSVRQDVTVAVEWKTSSPLSGHAAASGRMRLSGRQQGYCRIGSDVLLVPITGGRVLSIGAPCVIAARFAADALRRLPA
jgi:hypothetical protein